jgi:hypothetical protein
MSLRETQRDLEILGLPQQIRELQDLQEIFKSTPPAGGSHSGVTVKNTGVAVNNAPALNFIPGSNITITTTKNNAGDQTDITIAGSAPAYGTLANPFPAAGFYMYASDGTLELVTIDSAIPDWVITPVEVVATPYYLQEDGASFYLQEDGIGKYILG